MGSACSPSGSGSDASIDSPVCEPDSGGMGPGCACDPTKYGEQVCYTGPLGTQNVGLCQTGKRTCTPNGTISECVGEVLPVPEICNYADDNCDGIVDNVLSIIEAGAILQCYSPACDQTMNMGPDYADAAIKCWGESLGICGAGVKACVGGPKGGTPTGCTEFIASGVPEVCNGLDDDCNGLIDDGLNMMGPCTLEAGTPWSDFPDADLSYYADAKPPKEIYGACLNGNLSCQDQDCPVTGPNANRVCYDAGPACAPATPIPEVCNGLDDNCNNVIDEGTCDAYKSFNEQYCCTYTVGQTGFCIPTSDLSLYEEIGYTCHNGW